MFPHFSNNNPPTPPSLNSTTPIIPFRNRNPHPPSITTKPQRSHTPPSTTIPTTTKFCGSIIFNSFPSNRIPNCNWPISTTTCKCSMYRMKRYCVYRIYSIYFCDWVFYSMGSEGVVFWLFGGGYEVIGYSSFYWGWNECYTSATVSQSCCLVVDLLRKEERVPSPEEVNLRHLVINLREESLLWIGSSNFRIS